VTTLSAGSVTYKIGAVKKDLLEHLDDINDIIDINLANLLIRNLDNSTKAALRTRAATNGRSMEEEARRILDVELRRNQLPRQGLGTRLRRTFLESGALGSLEIPPRKDQ